MVTPELNQPQHLAIAGTAVIATTLLAGCFAVLDPAIARSSPPHPTLSGNLDDWLSITIENLRVLATPFLLWLLGADKSRLGRRAGDILIVAVIAVNAIPVGIALGRWQGRLIPYLPQLPLEWAALTVAVSAWLTIRTTTATRRHVAVLAVTVAVLVLAAAALETWGTPHRRPIVIVSREAVDAVHRRSRRVAGRGLLSPRILRRGGRVAATGCEDLGGLPSPSFADLPANSLQGRQLPSPRQRLGSARPSGRRFGLRQPPDPHKEGTKDERLSTRS